MLLQLLSLLGAAGLFLYGLNLLSAGMLKLSGDKFKTFLPWMRKNPVNSILAGFSITALAESSSAATVMVVGFVNAGALALSQAILVIMGANIGASFTAWIIATLGFGLGITSIVYPFFALGFILTMSKGQKRKISGEVIVPFMPDVEMDGVTFRIPAKGDKLAILELSTKNAKEFQFNSIRQKEHTDPDQYRKMVVEELRKALGMKELPMHIECFDNSNIQGTNPVASCVVFRNGVPSKKDYRKFKIKTVIGANDYASMKEVVNRRYSRMLREDPDDLPQLIVIDGGKGQLDFAYQALAELGLTDKLTVVGLAKRLEEVIRVGDPYPLFIDRNSSALKVLQQIRDEAHRFGITFHRSLRSKSQIESALTRIKGVGEQTEKRLLIHYGSVPRIAAAPIEDLISFLGKRELAERIHTQLNTNDDEIQREV